MRAERLTQAPGRSPRFRRTPSVRLKTPTGRLIYAPQFGGLYREYARIWFAKGTVNVTLGKYTGLDFVRGARFHCFPFWPDVTKDWLCAFKRFWVGLPSECAFSNYIGPDCGLKTGYESLAMENLG